MARYDDLNTKMIAYATVLSLVILVIVLQGTQALCYSMVNYESSRKDVKIIDAATVAKSEQLESLNSIQTVEVLDEAAPPAQKGEQPAMKSVNRIPIQEAQKLILKQLGKPSSNPTVPGA
jgi:hypothetical protein